MIVLPIPGVIPTVFVGGPLAVLSLAGLVAVAYCDFAERPLLTEEQRPFLVIVVGAWAGLGYLLWSGPSRPGASCRAGLYPEVVVLSAMGGASLLLSLGTWA